MTLFFVIIIACVSAVIYFGQDRMFFYPREYGQNSALQLERYQKITFETAKDGPQMAYYLGPENEAGLEKLWILTGGNGSLALHMDFLATPVCKQNPKMGCLLVEYPGYGVNAGKPSRKGIQEVMEGSMTALAAHLEIDTEGLKSRSSFLGHSLGGAVALEAAAKWNRSEVIVISPFTSIKAMAKRMVGGPLSNLARHRWDNEDAIRKITEQRDDAKIFIFHGAKDRIVPVEMGRALSKIAPRQTFYAEYPTYGHNEIGYELRQQLIARMIQ